MTGAGVSQARLIQARREGGLGRGDGLVPAGAKHAEGQEGSGRSNHPLHRYLLA